MDHFRCCPQLTRPLVLLLALLHLISAPPCFAKKKKPKDKKSNFHQSQLCVNSGFNSDSDGMPDEDTVNEFLGIPYRRGGTGGNGIDCSGLSRRFYLEMFGIDLPHSSKEQCRLNIFDKVPLNPEAFESRDLLFFQNKSKRINHVGIYLEDGKFLHATPRNGVIISSLDESYWKRRLVASRRIKDTVLERAFRVGSSSTETRRGTRKTNEISMGYAADISRNLHVDLETFYSGLFLTHDLLAGGSPDQTTMLSGPWQGIRAATHIRPADWLRITPSIGVLDGPSIWCDGDGKWQVYGLETAFSPLSSRWSFVFSMQSLLNESYYSAYGDAMDTDVGLHFNYWVSETLRLSVTGNWEGSYLMRDTENGDLTQDHMSFNLDLSF